MTVATAAARDLDLPSIVGDQDTFLASIWQSRRAVGQIADPALLSVLAIADVEQILSCSLARFPYVKLSKFGTAIPPASYTRARRAGHQAIPGFPDPVKISELFAGGATIVLNKLDEWHPPVARICHRLSRALGGYVEAGAYLTPPGSRALPLHRDAQDLFVVQFTGTKHWVSQTASPDAGWAEGPLHPGEDLAPTTLRAGQYLYLPRGAAHRAEASTDECSLHVTFGVNRVDSGTLRADIAQLVDQALAVVGLPATSAQDDKVVTRIADTVALLARAPAAAGSAGPARPPAAGRCNTDPDAPVLPGTVTEPRR